MVDVGGAALHLGQVDQPGLVEVDEAAPFGGGVVQMAVQAGEFGGEQFVVGGGCVGSHGLFAGEEHVGACQGVADLVEDEGVERVGADVAFRAAVLGPAGADDVVVATVVVAVPGAVASAHPVAVGADRAGAAFDQAPQQPVAGLGPAWAPFAVVAADVGGGEEGVL